MQWLLVVLVLILTMHARSDIFFGLAFWIFLLLIGDEGSLPLFSSALIHVLQHVEPRVFLHPSSQHHHNTTGNDASNLQAFALSSISTTSTISGTVKAFVAQILEE